MTLRTKDGRQLCELRDPGSDGPVLRLHPKLYVVLRKVLEGKLACTVELNFTDVGLSKTHIRVDGETVSLVTRVVTATLQPEFPENNFKVS